MQEKIERISATALEILQRAGIRLVHPETLDLFTDKGIHITGETAYFTPDQIREWISPAPSEFSFNAPNDNFSTTIGGNNSEFISAYGCAAIAEPDGSRRDALLDDYIEISRLIHTSPLFNINGGILAQPNDIPADQSHLIMLYTAMMNSDKCILGVPGSRQEMEDLMALAALRYGNEDFTAAPRLMTMISTISPLQMDDMALSSIIVGARNNQPLIISPAPAAGTTGPIDLASNLALATAEALAGIAIAQMVNPGTPVLFGLQCYGADLRTGNIAIGSPAYALQAKYTAALARHFGVPSRCGGTTNDAKVVSAQSGYESMLSMFTACQNGVNLIVHSAGILDSFAAFSYEQFIIDLEIIEMSRYYLNDIEVSDATLNPDLVCEVGPGGQFLTAMDTMTKCRTHSWSPSIAVSGALKPGTDPHEKYQENINQKRQTMLDAWTPPEIPADILAAMMEFMYRKGVDRAILDKINPYK
ncbi:MAG: trimethylamine methyltransferase family protein [Desulfobacterales bacterium]|nr:trimethylamine methyltransferase family protein [Desulfobacterales bacterium]